MSAERCKARVRGFSLFGPQPTCDNKATRDGYCGVHHPDTVAKRKAAVDARSNAAYAQRQASWAVSAAERAVLTAVRAGDTLALVTATSALHEADTALAALKART